MTRSPNLANFLLASAFATAFAAPCALSQTADTTATQPKSCPTQTGPMITKTFHLAYTNTDDRVSHDGTQLLAVLRNMLCPGDKTYLVNGQGAIVVQAPAGQIALAEKLISDLDHPRKAYRLLYTITEIDAGNAVGTQHLSMVVVTGQQTSMREGDKIPVATGTYSSDNAAASGSHTQFTYLDVGMNFDATVNEVANGVSLQSKIDQSSLGQPSTIAGIQEPVVRQTALQGTSFLSLGKPVMLGSVDVPDSTRHFDIAVVLEPVK